jgi:transcriptional regulator with XRE-family HTH domain
MSADGVHLSRNSAQISTRTDFAAALRALREGSRLTNKRVAGALHLAESTVSPWFNRGDRLPSEEHLIRLLRLLRFGDANSQKAISPDWTLALQRAKGSPLVSRNGSRFLRDFYETILVCRCPNSSEQSLMH